MGLIEDNSDSIAHLILVEADLEFSGFTITTANPWNPEQSGNSSGRLGGTHDLVRYVVETTEGGKLLMLWYSSPGVSYPTYRCRKAPGQALGHRDVARPWPRQVTAENRHTPRCFQPVIGAHLPDGILRLLVENARQLKESSGAADDGSIIRGHQIPN